MIETEKGDRTFLLGKRKALSRSHKENLLWMGSVARKQLGYQCGEKMIQRP